MKVVVLICILFQFPIFGEVAAKNNSFSIYLDADFSNHLESSESIERGLKVALETVQSTIMGRSVKIIRKDHRGNSARSKRHIKQFSKDSNALLMVSGIHSPPLLAHRDYINENEILFLIPWAAAGPITRYPSDQNWIFRLSIDDSKAGKVIANYAIKKKKYKKPYLLLENTGWGKSNEKTMSKSLKGLGISDFKVGWFNWNLKKAGANSLINDILKTDSDVVFLVANSIEGAVIVDAMASQPSDKVIPILSHWGIIGGDFHKKVIFENRLKVDLTFLQTKFSFLNNKLSKYQSNVLAKTKSMFPDVKSAKDILAPTGFIHAHDLVLLLIEASKAVEPNQSISKIRKELRSALEEIKSPVQGLIKTYKQPFSIYSKSNPDAHEALETIDFVMASFGINDEIILNPWRFQK